MLAMMIRFLCLSAACRTTSLPVKLVDTDSTVFSRIVLTPRAAAMCITRSDCSVNLLTRALSRISPWWISTLLCKWAMLDSWPVERLSRITGVSPCAIRASQRCEPMKPAPPVRNTRMGQSYVFFLYPLGQTGLTAVTFF